MKLNKKIYELYKLNNEGLKVTSLDIRRDDNIMLVINGICTDIKIDLLFETISKKFGNVIKGYSVLQNFGLVVDKETKEGFLIDKKENRLSLFNPVTNENIFFDNIRNPFIQMGDININKETEERYILILHRAYSQVLDEEVKETKTENETTNNIEKEKVEESNEEIKEPIETKETGTIGLTIEQIEDDFKQDGWEINKNGNLSLFTKEKETPILSDTSNDKITELEFVSSNEHPDGTIIHKFKLNENEDIEISLIDGKIQILAPLET